ncbi:GNAT family N-acetyltransferase [Thalassotalea euphylliae]|uniref:GNAT family N-acetyltransferase n=1 Tax=Thalassotalea euphylliae TaxID=1655234 RepID=UPI003624D170
MELATLTPENLTFSTARFFVRPMTTKDFTYFHAMQTSEQLMTYVGELLNDDDIRTKFDARCGCFSEYQQWFTLLVFELDTQAFVGSIGFHLADLHSYRVEVGFVVMPNAQGKGVTTEVAQPLLDFIFLKLNAKKVIALCSTDNISSQRVLDKLGMRQEGLLRADFRIGNSWQDSYTYGLVNPY